MNIDRKSRLNLIALLNLSRMDNSNAVPGILTFPIPGMIVARANRMMEASYAALVVVTLLLNHRAAFHIRIPKQPRKHRLTRHC